MKPRIQMLVMLVSALLMGPIIGMIGARLPGLANISPAPLLIISAMSAALFLGTAIVSLLLVTSSRKLSLMITIIIWLSAGLTAVCGVMGALMDAAQRASGK